MGAAFCLCIVLIPLSVLSCAPSLTSMCSNLLEFDLVCVDILHILLCTFLPYLLVFLDCEYRVSWLVDIDFTSSVFNAR